MFSISNEAAYNNNMVSQVQQTDGGDIRAVLGPSSWFNVDGDTTSKWCADEGSKVVELFEALRQSHVKNPDIFIITPFRIVAQKCGKG